MTAVTPLDAGAREIARHIGSPALTYVMNGFSLVGRPLVLGILAAIAVVFLLRAGRKHAAAVLAIVMCGAVILDQSLKPLVHRARPKPLFGTPLPASYSFPSGHALGACCFFGVLALLLTSRESPRHVRVAIWSIAAFMALMIGLSRIYLGVHYATDVIAGYAAGLIWMAVVMRISRRYARHL